LERTNGEAVEEGGKSENEQVEEKGRGRRGERKEEVGDGGIKCDRDRNGNGNIGGVGMTLICGRGKSGW
jgi:hypothetical protein